MKIILTTLNARYAHSAIGLRYLYANLHELQDRSMIMEFSINDATQTIAEKLLQKNPSIIGIGVYIWNAREVADLVHILKKVSPQTIIILGGPEVSYTPLRVDFNQVDYIIQGEGERSFYNLCKDLIQNPQTTQKEKPHTIAMDLPKLKELNLPYSFYTNEDIKNRYIYVEVSRGCPFLCEFCLSSIDEKVRTFDLDKVLQAFEDLWQRGARAFKFVDRTFNINIRTANKILDFFLSKEEEYFVHFEVIPDHFPLSLRQKLQAFPPRALQLEIGIQTLNPEIGENISRTIDLHKMRENISFLENQTDAHIHLDLIVGLPGESLESFGENLNTLVSLSSCEIQIGILKKLSGTHIDRHDQKYEMIYSDIPPYDILQNKDLSFETIQIMKRFARFWDLLYNSKNFKSTLLLLWQKESVFTSFYALCLWIYTQTDATYKISLDRISALLFKYLTEVKKEKAQEVALTLEKDILGVKGRAIPPYLKPYLKATQVKEQYVTKSSNFNKRQKKL